MLILLVLMAASMAAQTTFRTIVPSLPVVAGESFRVQYILSGAVVVDNFSTPDFRPFRFVAGPDVYIGETSGGASYQQSKNYVFTLVSPKPGKYRVPGAAVKLAGRLVKSDDVMIEVMSKEMAAKIAGQDLSSDYMLRPGENVQEKIKQNLFIKVSVNKRTCYVGEPVMATFKLYSRLESKSDIIKNPGFYGFTVYDMVNLKDKMVTTENINGRSFDVHTIRKVQLYPLQAGTFSVDAMQVNNKVELSRSAVSKKTEQEISEGILGMDDEDKPGEGVEVFETTISTEPVSITVKPMPVKNKPAGFSGATGRFSIAAALLKNDLAKNEEGLLEITITGKGNFVQINAPVVQWPAGIEGFEPIVKDLLDKTVMPLQGTRTFRYAFVSSNPGNYKLPVISFSFFDTDSNTFKTVSTTGINVSVNTEEKKAVIISGEKKTSIEAQSKKASLIAGIVVVAAVLVIVLYWLIRKKEKPPVITTSEKPTYPSIASLLEPAYQAKVDGPGTFFRELHQAIWSFLQQRFSLDGSNMNKQLVTEKMITAGIDGEMVKQLLAVLSQCEAGMFTQADMAENKEELLQHTEEVLKTISSAQIFSNRLKKSAFLVRETGR